MKSFIYALEVLLLTTFVLAGRRNRATHDKFPQKFKFGVNTLAYHVEGAWNQDGKGPEVFDTFEQQYPENMTDMSNLDISANHYNLYREDVQNMKKIGVNFYSFSFSWARIMPDGSLASLNMKAIRHYNDLIDDLICNGIEPVAAMTEYDVPQALQNLGGFTNPVIVKYFEAYADVLFHYFGDRVKTWTTIDAAYGLCSVFYGNGYIQPTILPVYGISQYLCAHNVLKAHATAYWLYQKHYAKRYKGRVGFELYAAYFYSLRNKDEDARKALDFWVGWFAHPVFSRKGNYPAVMRRQIREISERQGYSESRLPTFSKKWIRKIRGSADFMGLTYFASYSVTPRSTPLPYNPNNFYPNDALLNYTITPGSVASTAPFTYYWPEGLGDLLRYVRDEYDNPETFITRVGWADSGGLNDQFRIKYFRTYLQQALDSIADGCNLKRFTAYSLLDGSEYRYGYTAKFGLYEVDFTSPARTRTARASAEFYRQVSLTHRIPKQ